MPSIQLRWPWFRGLDCLLCPLLPAGQRGGCGEQYLHPHLILDLNPARNVGGRDFQFLPGKGGAAQDEQLFRVQAGLDRKGYGFGDAPATVSCPSTSLAIASPTVKGLGSSPKLATVKVATRWSGNIRRRT